MNRFVAVSDFVKNEPTVPSTGRAYQLIREGILPVYRRGARVFVDLERWEQFKTSGGRGAKPQEAA
jgi:hypothetical protein